jgi:hypothetical protein
LLPFTRRHADNVRQARNETQMKKAELQTKNGEKKEQKEKKKTF